MEQKENTLNTQPALSREEQLSIYYRIKADETTLKWILQCFRWLLAAPFMVIGAVLPGYFYLCLIAIVFMILSLIVYWTDNENTKLATKLLDDGKLSWENYHAEKDKKD